MQGEWRTKAKAVQSERKEIKKAQVFFNYFPNRSQLYEKLKDLLFYSDPQPAPLKSNRSLHHKLPKVRELFCLLVELKKIVGNLWRKVLDMVRMLLFWTFLASLLSLALPSAASQSGLTFSGYPSPFLLLLFPRCKGQYFNFRKYRKLKVVRLWSFRSRVMRS